MLFSINGGEFSELTINGTQLILTGVNTIQFKSDVSTTMYYDFSFNHTYNEYSLVAGSGETSIYEINQDIIINISCSHHSAGSGN